MESFYKSFTDLDNCYNVWVFLWMFEDFAFKIKRYSERRENISILVTLYHIV